MRELCAARCSMWFMQRLAGKSLAWPLWDGWRTHPGENCDLAGQASTRCPQGEYSTRATMGLRRGGMDEDDIRLRAAAASTAVTQYAGIIIQTAGIIGRGPKVRAGWALLGAMPGDRAIERCGANALTPRGSLVGPRGLLVTSK